ncbi:protein of unknown function [Acidithiobacillus ferrivorans]|uniref:Uncharacterized protein n=1 Tax=Acidithiobacillus ferrivorans TaxID=160808 RepID=A0A060UVG7_9PROT|nr:hypothetical protein AFERRI_400310 [Acidithiobacillus ferrivorans]SMH64559.1 protein of unknown function [Acidithiobacillus ferrivorans]
MTMILSISRALPRFQVTLKYNLVGIAGFEPAVSWPQTMRLTGLGYIPKRKAPKKRHPNKPGHRSVCFGWGGRTRTCDIPVNSRSFYR